MIQIKKPGGGGGGGGSLFIFMYHALNDCKCEDSNDGVFWCNFVVLIQERC